MKGMHMQVEQCRGSGEGGAVESVTCPAGVPGARCEGARQAEGVERVERGEAERAGGVRGRVTGWTVALLGLAWAPAAYLGWLIYTTAVNILYLDEWGCVFLFRKLAAHTLTVGDLLAQHNESRPAVPLAMILGVGSVTQWDVRYDMWMGFGFVCLVSLNIYLLSRRFTNMGRNQRLLLWLITNVLLFSTAQSQNWTWGIQMIVVMPMLFISTGILLAYSRLQVGWKFLLAAALASASTFSFAIGQIAWIVLLPALVVGSWGQRRKFGWPLAMWVAAWGANLWVYFHNYEQPAWHPSVFLPLRHPIDGLAYFTAYLGAALAQGYGSVGVSIAFGVVLVGVLGFMCRYLWRIRRRPGTVALGTIWLTLCGYAVGAAGVTTAGRMGWGLMYSQDSRYTAFSMYLVIGLVYLGAMVVRDLHRRKKIGAARNLVVGGLALLVIPMISTEINGTDQMWEIRRDRLRDKGMAQWASVFPMPPSHYKIPFVQADDKEFMDRTGILSPGLVKSADVSKIAGEGGGEAFGRMEGMRVLEGTTCLVRGWAILPYRHQTGAVVVLAGEDGSGRAVAFGETPVLLERPDVVEVLHDRTYLESGWEVEFDSRQVPAWARTISAWVYDPENGRAYRLAGEVK